MSKNNSLFNKEIPVIGGSGYGRQMLSTLVSKEEYNQLLIISRQHNKVVYGVPRENKDDVIFSCEGMVYSFLKNSGADFLP